MSEEEEELRKKAEKSEQELMNIGGDLDKSKQATIDTLSKCGETIQKTVEDAKKKSSA